MASAASAVPSIRALILAKSGVATGRSGVAEGAESAVVGGAELLDRNVSRRFQDAVANFLRRFRARVDRRDHPDENPLLRLEVLTNNFQDPDPLPFPASAT